MKLFSYPALHFVSDTVSIKTIIHKCTLRDYCRYRAGKKTCKRGIVCSSSIVQSQTSICLFILFAFWTNFSHCASTNRLNWEGAAYSGRLQLWKMLSSFVQLFWSIILAYKFIQKLLWGKTFMQSHWTWETEWKLLELTIMCRLQSHV